MAMVEDLRKSGPSGGSGGVGGGVLLAGAGADDDVDADEHLPPLEVSAGDHRLQYTYGLWYIGKTNYQQYDLTLRKIGRFASVEQFWALYSHLVRPSDLHSPSDFFLFKDGIKPMWEHKGNCNGGQWTVRLNKGLAARCWENLVLAVLGEQFNVGDEICGAGVSMRAKKDCISLWHKTSADTETSERIKESMRKVLNLPSNIALEYRNHKEVLNWVSTRDRDPLMGGSAGGGGGRGRDDGMDYPIGGGGGRSGGAPGMPPLR